MKKNNLMCERCGIEFEAQRSDAKYCSGTCRTLASKEKTSMTEKTNGNVKVILEFSKADISSLSDRLEYSGLSLQEYIKVKSLNDSFNINNEKETILNQQKELNLLKAEIRHFKGEYNPGIFLEIEEEKILEIEQSLSVYAKLEKSSLEEVIIDICVNFSAIIDETIKATKEAVEKKLRQR